MSHHYGGNIMKDIKKISTILKISFVILMVIGICLVFFSFPYKQFIVLGICIIGFIIFFLNKHLQEKGSEKSKKSEFKKKVNCFHMWFTIFAILIALFFVITRS